MGSPLTTSSIPPVGGCSLAFHGRLSEILPTHDGVDEDIDDVTSFSALSVLEMQPLQRYKVRPFAGNV